MEAQTTCSTLEDSWFDSPRCNRFISSAMLPHLCGEHGLLYFAYPRVKWPWREADHSPCLTNTFKGAAAQAATHTSWRAQRQLNTRATANDSNNRSIYTVRFIMFSVIVNIYNRKTKWHTLMELFTATGKLKKVFFLTTGDVRCVHHWWHGTHRYDIQVLATHASTLVHWYSSLLQRSVALGQRIHVFLSVGGSFAYFARNARCTATTDLLCDIPTHKTTSPPERPFSHYIHSHCLAAEMWTTMKQNLLGEKKIWVVPSICTGFVNTCPTFSYNKICNSGLRYETPCIVHISNSGIFT